MPKIFDIIKDKDFQALSYQEKKGVLSHFDQGFSGLPEPEQDRVMQHFNLNQPELSPDEIMPVQKAASDIYTPALVTLGGIGGYAAGTATGAPTGPGAIATAMAGSALGMAGGEAASNWIDRLTGLKPPIQSAGEAISETGQNLLHGAEYEAGGQVITKAASAVMRPLSSMIDDAGRLIMSKAKDMGIELTPAEVIRSKGLSLIEGLMDIAPISGDISDKFHMVQAKELIKQRNRLLNEHGSPEIIESLGEKIQQAADDLIRTHTKVNAENQLKLKDVLLKKLGSNQGYAEAGFSGQEALKLFSEKRFEEAGKLLESVGELIDPSQAHIPKSYRGKAKELLKKQKMASSSLQDSEVLSVLSDISGNAEVDKALVNAPHELRELISKELENRPANPMTWAQMVADRTRLGKLIAENDPSYGFSPGAKGMKGVSNEAAGVYKQLFKALDEDMGNVVKQYGPEAEQAMELARSYYGESKQMFKTPLMMRIAKADPERVIDMVFKPGAVTPIRMTRKAIGNEAFDGLKKSFTNRLFETPENMPLTADLLSARLKKYGSDTIHEIYGQEVSAISNFPEKLRSLDPELANNQFFKNILKRDPSKVIDYIVQPNNTVNADKLVDGLGERMKAKIGQGLMSKILQDAAMNAQGDFSPSLLNSAMNRYGDDVLSKWLPEDALRDLKDFAQISIRLPKAAVLGNNPSGTGRVIIGAAAGSYFFYNPKRAIKIAIPAAILAQMYFSPTGRKYLLDGLTTTLRSPEAQSVFNRIASSALALIDQQTKEND